MRGYVVEFADQDEYLLCTESELESLKAESKLAGEEYRKKEEERKAAAPDNPA